MSSEKEQLEQLRVELAEMRQRELLYLKERIKELTEERNHYRTEAQRNADLGKQIAAEYESERKSLLDQIEALRKVAPKRR